MTSGESRHRRATSPRFLRAALSALGLILIPATSPSAFAETRGYVVSMIHTATYGDKDTCPKGGNGGNRETRERRLIAYGLSKEEAAKIAASTADEIMSNSVVEGFDKPADGAS